MKKKQITQLLLLVVCLFVALSANAQASLQRSDTLVAPPKSTTTDLPPSQDALKDSLLKEVSNYPFIFEGTIREITVFEDDKHEIWTSTLIQIHKSFKGNLQSGTVELMTKNIDIFADKHSPRPPLPRKLVQRDTTSYDPGQIGSSGVFFLDTLCYLPIIKIKKRDCTGNPIDIAISLDTTASPTPKAIFGDKTTNKIKLTCSGKKIWYNLAKNSKYEHNTSLGIGYISRKNSRDRKYGEIAFEDTIEVYDFIRRIENTNVIDFTKKQFRRTDYKWQKKRNDSPLNFKTNLNQEKQVILDRLNSINSTAKKNLKIASDNNISYFFENEAYIKVFM